LQEMIVLSVKFSSLLTEVEITIDLQRREYTPEKTKLEVYHKSLLNLVQKDCDRIPLKITMVYLCVQYIKPMEYPLKNVRLEAKHGQCRGLFW
jgi:hypothetical protein